MPEALLVPIAAVDRTAIERHVGQIVEQVPGTRGGNAFRVLAECGPERSDLAVWQHHRAPLVSQRVQVWVDAKYSGYRKAYRAVFPEEDPHESVIHHVMNR